eukprot:gene4307-5030_t
MCTEWTFNSPSEGVDCFGSRCLFAQHCNETSERCEFTRCESEESKSLCTEGMVCVQFDVTHPRVCASRSVVPFSTVPDWLRRFPFIQSGGFR